MSQFRIVRAGCICIAAFGLLLVAGCTTYYKVHDPSTGRTYYSTEVKHLDSGATELKDARTGKEVRVQTSEVEKITKEEFETGKAEPTTRPM